MNGSNDLVLNEADAIVEISGVVPSADALEILASVVLDSLDEFNLEPEFGRQVAAELRRRAAVLRNG